MSALLRFVIHEKGWWMEMGWPHRTHTQIYRVWTEFIRMYSNYVR
jgi:hypothetical protein